MNSATFADISLLLLILSCLRLLGGSRLMASISTVAYQGLVIGVLPLTLTDGLPAGHVAALAIMSIVVKGFILPRWLRNAVRESVISRDIQPLIGLNISLVFGLAALGIGGWVDKQLPLPPGISPHGAPVAIMMILTGLFLVVARRQALTQALGYLVLENGIFMFGLLFVHGTPWLVEAGVLLDVLTGIFIMGITIFQINRAFHAMDSGRLTTLHDLHMHRPDGGDES